MRDVDFPARGKEGFLDIERTGPLLPDAATLWISDFIDLYENNTVLPKPRVAEIALVVAIGPVLYVLRRSHGASRRPETR